MKFEIFRKVCVYTGRESERERNEQRVLSNQFISLWFFS
jgi:hypothetical protein